MTCSGGEWVDVGLICEVVWDGNEGVGLCIGVYVVVCGWEGVWLLVFFERMLGLGVNACVCVSECLFGDGCVW